MKKALLPALIALACSGAAGAADLLAVYRDAVANDQVFAAAQASQIAGQEKMPQGRAGLLPTVSASASTTWNDLDSKSRTPNAATRAAEYNSHAWSIQLSQPLFRWQNWVQYKQTWRSRPPCAPHSTHRDGGSGQGLTRECYTVPPRTVR